MESAISQLGRVVVSSGAWLLAVIVPIVRTISQAIKRRRDFDIPSTALLPALLMIVASAIAFHAAWAPRGGGLPALLTWIGYRPLEAACLLGVLFIGAIVLGITLLFWINRPLLRLWCWIPLHRDPECELPIVDRKGVIKAFIGIFNEYLALPERYASNPLSLVQRFLSYVFPGKQASFVRIGRRKVTRDDVIYKKRLRALVLACEEQAQEVVQNIRDLAEGNTDAIEVDAANTSSSGSSSVSPERLQRMLEDLFDGINPRFLAAHRALVRDVVAVQQSICDVIALMQSKVADPTTPLSLLSKIGTLTARLQDTSRGLAWNLAQFFGIAGGLRTGASFLEGEGHANSLAYNIEMTSLGRRDYWQPVDRYNWVLDAKFTDDQLVVDARNELLLVEKLKKELAKKELAAEAPPLKAKRSRRRSAPPVPPPSFEEIVDERMEAEEKAKEVEEKAEKARDNARKRLEEHNAAVTKHVAALRRLRDVRSKVLAYLMLASALVAIGVVGGIAIIGSWDAHYLWAAIPGSLVALFIAAAIAVHFFVKPATSYAFYLSLLENRLHREALDKSAGSWWPPSGFNWAAASPPRIRLRAALVILGVATLPLVGHAALLATGGVDYRLVVTAGHDFEKGDQIVGRSLSDMLVVDWQRCNSTWPKDYLRSPDELKDTYLLGGCSSSNGIFARPFAVGRSGDTSRNDDSTTAGKAQCLNYLFGQMRHETSQRCKSTINKPIDDEKKLTRESPNVVDLQHSTTIQVKSMQILAERIDLTSSGQSGPTIAYLDTAPTEVAPNLYVFIDGKGDNQQRVAPVGSLYFNFDCDKPGGQSHCKLDHECAKLKPSDTRFKSIEEINQINDRSLDQIGQIVKGMQAGQVLVVAGWTDASGEDSYNTGLAYRRASSVISAISSPENKDKLAGAHILGGAGKGNARENCDWHRRRTDVYLINSMTAASR